MIANQILLTSFFAPINYNEKKIKKDKGSLIGGNMLSSDARTLAKEFEMIRALRPSVSNAVYHTSLSIAPDEKLTDEQFEELTIKYLNAMGFANSQYLIYRHTDTNHPHSHIVANRVSMDGQVVSDKWNYKRSEKIVRKLEKEYGLKEVISSERAKEKAYSTGQFQQMKKTNQAPVRTQLQILVKEALMYSNSINEFEAEMNNAFVNVRFHTNSKGNVFGVSFELEGIKFKASQLGKDYSWNKIKTQLNNESSKGPSEEKYRRESSNIRSTSQKNSASERQGHTGVEGGFISNIKGLRKVGDGDQEGRGQFGPSLHPIQEDAGFRRETNASDGVFSKANEEEAIFNEMESLSDGNTDRAIHRHDVLPGIVDSSEDEFIDEEEFLKKKKKKIHR